jgi:hypothetical protein
MNNSQIPATEKYGVSPSGLETRITVLVRASNNLPDRKTFGVKTVKQLQISNGYTNHKFLIILRDNSGSNLCP